MLGLPGLREAVAQLHRDEDLLHCEADDILISPGTKMLLYLTMRLFHGGEREINSAVRVGRKRNTNRDSCQM